MRKRQSGESKVRSSVELSQT
uniref:Uncharacterized protein n=1 Tax=Arundo donax TaxID=35708 RepID=A0A0A8ZB78_ARUDO